MAEPAIIILGATSAIAHAYARRCAAGGVSFLLVGRNRDLLEANAADLRARGASSAMTEASDLAITDNAAARWDGWLDRLGGRFDRLVLAYGQLGDQTRAERDPTTTEDIIMANFTSATTWLGLAANSIGEGPAKQIIAIGSVAGDRGRQSNYIYGSAKAGLAVFMEGLAHRLAARRVQVLMVKPGFVESPMTDHLSRTGLLWTKPDRIAADIERAVRSGRHVLYTPWYWRIIMTLVCLMPRPLFHRTKL